MFYQPGQVPSDPKDIPVFLMQELQRLSLQLSQGDDSIILNTLYAAPSRIVEGMVVKADGTTWNPGSGAGVYARIGGAWVKL